MNDNGWFFRLHVSRWTLFFLFFPPLSFIIMLHNTEHWLFFPGNFYNWTFKYQMEKKRKMLRKVLISFSLYKEYPIQWCNDINNVISFHVIAWILSNATLKFYLSAHCIWGAFLLGCPLTSPIKVSGTQVPSGKKRQILGENVHYQCDLHKLTDEFGLYKHASGGKAWLEILLACLQEI